MEQILTDNIKYPYMLIMRNSIRGLIWQAYIVKNEIEEKILTKNAKANGFIVEIEPVGYAKETFPNWRDDDCWKTCLSNWPMSEDSYK